MFISAFLFQNIMLLVKILTTESSKSEADLGIIKGGGGRNMCERHEYS